jgi:hypothetical protein
MVPVVRLAVVSAVLSAAFVVATRPDAPRPAARHLVVEFSDAGAAARPWQLGALDLSTP